MQSDRLLHGGRGKALTALFQRAGIIFRNVADIFGVPRFQPAPAHLLRHIQLKFLVAVEAEQTTKTQDRRLRHLRAVGEFRNRKIDVFS